MPRPLSNRFMARSDRALRGHPSHRLLGGAGNAVEVLVVVNDDQTGPFGDSGNDEIGNGDSPVVSGLCQPALPSPQPTARSRLASSRPARSRSHGHSGSTRSPYGCERRTAAPAAESCPRSRETGVHDVLRLHSSGRPLFEPASEEPRTGVTISIQPPSWLKPRPLAGAGVAGGSGLQPRQGLTEGRLVAFANSRAGRVCPREHFHPPTSANWAYPRPTWEARGHSR